MKQKQKLELTWIGKENRPKLEPRILLEDPEKSYHAKQRVSENDIFDNRLIFGDNLLALKALEHEFSGKVKCVFIDPPYNTNSAFVNQQYDDGVEHSIWLSLMRDRLELIRRLLSDDGSLWLTIDDNEQPYLRILLDEVFGRANFVSQIIWQKVYSLKGSAKHVSDMHDYIVVYAKRIDKLSIGLVARSEKNNKLYKNPDNDPKGLWRPGPIAARNFYSLGTYSIKCPSGRVIEGPPRGSYWRYSAEKLAELDRQGMIWWGVDGNNVPAPKLYLSKVSGGVKPASIWLHDEVGNNQDAKKHLLALLPNVDEVFITPKPETLLERILHLTTVPGDLVLDSFAGSGTTGAVAHKMGRRWIMVELGDHCHTHIIPRLKKVIDGEDEGGITKAIDWKGGGGFRYYRLAPSLLEMDSFGNLVISKQYNAAMLAQAMCKLMGFTYAPSEEIYWQQGHSTENDFIYVTTQTMTRDHLAALSEEVGKKRSLLICCSAFRGKADAFHNLTLKKIPSAVLHKCEWGHDDYSLNVANMPQAPETKPAHLLEDAPLEPKHARRRKAKPDSMPSLFGNSDEGGAE